MTNPYSNNPPPLVIPPGAEPHVAKSRKRLWLFLFLIVIIIAAAAAADWWFMMRPAHKPLTKISVRLEWLNGPEFAGMDVAKDKGFYADEGLDVDLKEFQDMTDVNEEVATGKVDFGVSSPLEVILARDKGQKNKAIAAIYQTSAYSIVSQKSANIKSPSDLKGKILGNIGGNDQAKVTYTALLAYAGLSARDATIKDIDFDIVKDFQANEAETGDIFRTDQTFLLDQAHIPYDQLFPEKYGFAIYGDVLIASDTKIANDPDQTAAFVRATLKGWQYAIAHQDETLTILTKYENAIYKVPGYDKFSLSKTAPLIVPTGGQPIGSMKFVPWSTALQGVSTLGLIKTKFEVSDTYAPQFVK